MNSKEMYLIKISQTFAPLRLASCVRSSVRVCGRSVGFIHVPSLPRHVPSGLRTCHVSLQCCSITPSVSRPRWLRIRCGEASDGFRINGTRKSYLFSQFGLFDVIHHDQKTKFKFDFSSSPARVPSYATNVRE